MALKEKDLDFTSALVECVTWVGLLIDFGMSFETEFKHLFQLFDDIVKMSDQLGFSIEAPHSSAIRKFHADAARK